MTLFDPFDVFFLDFCFLAFGCPVAVLDLFDSTLNICFDFALNDLVRESTNSSILQKVVFQL
jgi:hypothetical protein